jgi:CDP-glycerol glycerophosphotransferase (TagB/SpsB family)
MLVNKFLNLSFNLLNYFVSKFYKRDKSLWIFGEWFGRKCNDNCLYFANYIAENHKEINCIWITMKDTDISRLSRNVKVVYFDTPESDTALKSAAVAIMGQNTLDFSSKGINKLGGALTLNLWHGVPWKKIGHDHALASNSILQKIYNYFYDLAFNSEYYLCTSKIYEPIWGTSFNAAKENIIFSGYPRNANFYCKDLVYKEKQEFYNKHKISSDYKLIAYLPTFRDGCSDPYPLVNLMKDIDFVDFMRSNKIIIIEKSHYAHQNTINSKNELEDVYRTIDNCDCQSLLAASDILITDYSGAFFDYLILNRPIIHFLYDYDNYKNNIRGLYFSKEHVVAGPVANNIYEVKEAILDCILKDDSYNLLRRDIRAKFMTFESKESNKKIYNFIENKILNNNAK